MAAAASTVTAITPTVTDLGDGQWRIAVPSTHDAIHAEVDDLGDVIITTTPDEFDDTDPED